MISWMSFVFLAPTATKSPLVKTANAKDLPNPVEQPVMSHTFFIKKI
jgi:hypothetical protein